MRGRCLIFVLLVLAVAAVAEDGDGRLPPLTFPEARRVDVVDQLHGVWVADPYRWMEEGGTEELAAWVSKQNALTRSVLDSYEGREGIRERLTTLWNHERYSAPFTEAGRYFYWHNPGLAPFSVLCVTDSLDGEARVLLDPATLSEDKTVAVRGTSVSPDGRWLAYGRTSGGSDWREWRVLDVATGNHLSDALLPTKFGGPNWSHDSRGFYYPRYPQPDPGSRLTDVNESPRIFFHVLGEDPARDELIWEAPEDPRLQGGVFETDDGRYQILNLWREGKSTNAIRYRERETGGEWKTLFPEDAGNFRIVDTFGPRFYVHETTEDHPRGRLLRLDVSAPDIPASGHSVVRPREDEVLRGVSILGGRILARFFVVGCTRVRTYSLDGEPLGDLPLPGLGAAGGFGGDDDDRETFFTWTDFTSPASIWHLDLTTMKAHPFRTPEVDFDGSRYEAKMRFATSRDGTRVPVFVVHRKGLELDGSHPVLLSGYGGFRSAVQPRFSVSRAVWLEMGGIYATPALRGGSEYGEAWHRAGMRERKQNVFDDFIAAAELLVSEGYTSPRRLGIAGGSNGGLLVGAVLNQRPDLFGAALPAVGVMDMLRFHRFTIGWAWVSEYGSPDDPAMFPHLLAYSPYHNLRRGISYPPTLVTTSDHDDRVVPAHSYKYAARLQAAQIGPNPILLRVETRGGHGGGLAMERVIEAQTDRWTFLAMALMTD